MKKYLKIENLRLDDIELGDGVVRKSNISSFELDDEVVIQEKIDGSCASFQYLGNGEFVSCSRRKQLDPANNLNGFYQYCERLAKSLHIKEKLIKQNVKRGDYDFIIGDWTNLILYGEWTGHRNVIVYDDSAREKWFVFDIRYADTGEYCPWGIVKCVCMEFELEHVQELAYIPHFKSWDTILPFANIGYSGYGKTQEGVVVKNQTKLLSEYLKDPIYLKIVNLEFRETKRVKRVKPDKTEEYKIAEENLSQIINVARVRKCLVKLIEDGELPKILKVQNLSEIAKVLPRVVYNDCINEEPEIMRLAGKYAGKICQKQVMGIARNLLSE